MIVKSVLKYPNPRKWLRPCAKATSCPLHGPDGPGKCPRLKSVSHLGCTKSASGLTVGGLSGGYKSSSGRQGSDTPEGVSAAPAPHGGCGPRGRMGTA